MAITTLATPSRGIHAPPPLIIWLAIGAYPAWWALGVTNIILPLLAIPAAIQLWRHRPIKVPPGFSLWLLFLAWVLISIIAINETAPGTLPPTGAGRYFAFTLRFAQYGAITVFLLFIGNLTERELPRRTVIRAIGLLAITTTAFGYLAMAFPTFSFTTPFSKVAPEALSDGVTPVVSLAQVQDVLGEVDARPAAPFAFTNTWGEVLSMAVVWLVVGWIVMGSRRRRVIGLLVVAAAVVPIVYSLNRAVWLAVGLAVIYVAVRLAARRQAGALVGLVAAGVIAGSVAIASPLGDVVTERLQTPHSDDVRAWLGDLAWDAAAESPFIGYGTTRDTIGSQQSIAIGQSPDCTQCGNRVVGSTGHLWLLLISQGVVGTALYVMFFLRNLLSFARDHSAIGIAGTLVILMSLFYMYFYSALNVPLLIVMVSIGLLWRNRLDHRPEIAEEMRS